MAKSKSYFVCNECGYRSAKWLGKCPECDSWGTLDEEVEISPRISSSKARNIVVGKSESKVYSFKEIEVENNFRYKTRLKEFDRVLMPLPRGAEDYLGVALKTTKKGTIVHFYDFLHENDFDKAKEKIAKACKKAKKKYRILEFVKCGQFGPGIFRICIDFKIL